MLEYFLTFSLCFFVLSQSPDFYLDIFVFGSQLSILPTYYLSSLLFPLFISSSSLLRRGGPITLSIKYIFFYLVFLIVTVFCQLDFDLLSDIIRTQSLFSKIIRSVAIFILSFVSYSVLFSRFPSYLTRRNFTSYPCILAFASLSSLLALVFYQSDFFIPSNLIDRFTSTLTAEEFLNPYQVFRFGLVESIPYKSFFARSHWFVLEPIHFAFYLLTFYSISLLTCSVTIFSISTFFLVLGLLCAKSLTSFISVLFALAFFFFKLTRPSSKFIIVSISLLPHFLYSLSQGLIQDFFALAGKSTNFENKVITFDNLSSFLHAFLLGDQTLPPISHNLVFNSLIHYGVFISLIASFILVTCLTQIYKPILVSPATKFSLSIVIALILFQLPDPTHPLYALLLSYVSACSNATHCSYAKITTT